MLQELRQLDKGTGNSNTNTNSTNINTSSSHSHSSSDAMGLVGHSIGTVIPANTRLVLEILPNIQSKCVFLNLAVNNNTIIKNVTMFSDVC